MKPLYILKLGGSVVTYKNRVGFSARKALLKKIANSIKKAKSKKDFDLILIHGAGSVGHQLAHEYGLREGVSGDAKKMRGSLLSRVANQKLNNIISDILVAEGLPVVSTHTASVIIQKDKHISECNTEIIKEAIRQNCIPLLYGEMVFDETLGMSVCSGDAIAPYLAKKLKAQKIFFASDIEGVFDKDPHIHKDAQLIEKINLKEVRESKEIKLTASHNIDVTDGLLGKIRNIDFKNAPSLQSVEIFNGLDERNYVSTLLDKNFPHSKISL